MSRNLLICAAVDLEGGNWFADCWPRIVASMRLGKAGDILSGEFTGAGLAVRLDRLPGDENPAERRLTSSRSPDGSYTLLAGRIMHRAELASRLGIALPEGDGELYAAAHHAWGEECDRALVGEYAAIQWFPEERCLRLARSPLQAPPLHVWRDGSRMVAASLPRSIFASGVRPQIDPARLADAGLLNFRDAAASYYVGLERVPCGAIAVHSPDRKEARRYWSVDGLTPLEIPDAQTAVEAVDAEMQQATEVTLEGARKPAVSLSGGLDSQAVASFALRQIGDEGKLQSFTAVPVEAWLPKPDHRLVYDERAHVSALAECYPALEPHFLTGEEAATGDTLDRMLLLGSWPVLNEMNAHWLHAIHRTAARSGCDVLLNGEFGDSGISYDGLAAFPQWLARGRWGQLLRELRAFDDGRPLWRRACAHAVMPCLPSALRRLIDRLRGQLASPFEKWSPLRAGHPQTLAALARAQAAGHDIHHFSFCSSGAARDAMIAAPLSEGPELSLALRLLYGIERRDPTAYRPLWELCARLPDELFLQGGVARTLARELLRGKVPEDVRRQKRVGIQSADMLGRIHRDRDRLLREFRLPAPAGSAAELLDFDRMARIAEASKGPQGDGERDWLRVAAMVPRGLALAHFVRHVEGRNDG
ncbi:asparagine synthase-related protein [Altererythrobacter sp. Z27]|uniref:asparagine synthase-related protein n=1 Tax=Altererythrobacter sp. Z27 TaxID=3461147 RepID=UPI004044B576